MQADCDCFSIQQGGSGHSAGQDRLLSRQGLTERLQDEETDAECDVILKYRAINCNYLTGTGDWFHRKVMTCYHCCVCGEETIHANA